MILFNVSFFDVSAGVLIASHSLSIMSCILVSTEDTFPIFQILMQNDHLRHFWYVSEVPHDPTDLEDV